MRRIEYIDYLKADYVNTALIINYDEENDLIISATLHSNLLGVINYESKLTEVHIWEKEDQVRNISDITKHYPAILLNGLSNDKKIKDDIILEIKTFLANCNITNQNKSVIARLFDLINN